MSSTNSAISMAEIHPKRPLEDSSEADDIQLDASSASISKRQKPYNNILSLLEEEEEEAADSSSELQSHDLSAMLTTLQRELSSTSSGSTDFHDFDFLLTEEAEHVLPPEPELVSIPAAFAGGCEDGGVRSVMRHLLEASDDELGIPNRAEEGAVGLTSAESVPFPCKDHGLWEFDDETSNYYNALQSELFM